LNKDADNLKIRLNPLIEPLYAFEKSIQPLLLLLLCEPVEFLQGFEQVFRRRAWRVPLAITFWD
jgi:hypothetical protein